MAEDPQGPLMGSKKEEMVFTSEQSPTTASEEEQRSELPSEEWVYCWDHTPKLNMMYSTLDSEMTWKHCCWMAFTEHVSVISKFVKSTFELHL